MPLIFKAEFWTTEYRKVPIESSGPGPAGFTRVANDRLVCRVESENLEYICVAVREFTECCSETRLFERTGTSDWKKLAKVSANGPDEIILTATRPASTGQDVYHLARKIP